MLFEKNNNNTICAFTFKKPTLLSKRENEKSIIIPSLRFLAVNVRKVRTEITNHQGTGSSTVT